MPELRKDPVVGRWVIISTERARRPGVIIDTTFSHQESETAECIYCHPKEQPIYLHKKGVSVIPFRKSFLQTNMALNRQKVGIYDVMNGFGSHEVVIETPKHIDNMADLELSQIQSVVETYAHRMSELSKMPHARFLTAFKNFGSYAGSRKIEHARSHIMATPINPLRIKDKLSGAKRYFDEHHSCVYCDLIKQDRLDNTRIVMETPHFIVLTPFAARFLFEVAIIPKRHHCDFSEGVRGVEKDLAQVLKTMLKKFKIGLDDPAYNYIVQTAPVRRKNDGSDKWTTLTEDFHWHIELMPRLTRIAGFEKGTGFYINAIPPEMTAGYLRDVDIS